MDKALMKKKQKTLLRKIKKEIDEEYIEQIKNKVKRKYKQVQMAKLTYEKLNKELIKLLTGKKVYTEEELLFEDEE